MCKKKKRKTSVSILLGTKEASVLVRAVRKKKKKERPRCMMRKFVKHFVC